MNFGRETWFYFRWAEWETEEWGALFRKLAEYPNPAGLKKQNTLSFNKREREMIRRLYEPFDTARRSGQIDIPANCQETD